MSQLNVPMDIPKFFPRLISKQRLREIFIIDDEGNSCSSYLLRKYHFDDEALEALGITEEQYDKIVIFDRRLTPKIYEYFNIKLEEFSRCA